MSCPLGFQNSLPWYHPLWLARKAPQAGSDAPLVGISVRPGLQSSQLCGLRGLVSGLQAPAKAAPPWRTGLGCPQLPPVTAAGTQRHQPTVTQPHEAHRHALWAIVTGTVWGSTGPDHSLGRLGEVTGSPLRPRQGQRHKEARSLACGHAASQRGQDAKQCPSPRLPRRLLPRTGAIPPTPSLQGGTAPAAPPFSLRYSTVDLSTGGMRSPWFLSLRLRREERKQLCSLRESRTMQLGGCPGGRHSWDAWGCQGGHQGTRPGSV